MPGVAGPVTMDDNKSKTKDFISYKQDGNALFKNSKYREALDLYSEALKLAGGEHTSDRAAILKNQAACYLKLEDYRQCAAVASQALELTPNDPKALFRRCQALEKLGKVDEAYKDVRLVAHMEPGDVQVREAVVRLAKQLEELSTKQANTDQKVTDMMKYLSGGETDAEKRRQAASNLVVLAREKSGAERLMDKRAPEQFVKILKDKNADPEVKLTVVRALAELFKGDIPRCRELLRNRIGLPPLADLFCLPNEALVNAVSVAIENSLRTLSGWIDKEKPDKALVKANWEDIDYTMTYLTNLVDRAVLSAAGRNAIVDVLVKNLPEYMSPGMGWTEEFIVKDGIAKLLAPAIVQPDDCKRIQSSLAVTNETRVHVALALHKVYDDLDSDRKRNLFREKAEAFVQGLLRDPDPFTKMQAILAVITLLQGPFDVGNFLLGSQNILEMLFVMATSDDTEHQMIAAEAIVQAASKKDKAAAIIGSAMDILQRLIKSPDDKVKVRALVGLCKAGSSRGVDSSNKPLDKETAKALSETCFTFLSNSTKDFDLRRWAAEGLAYLSLDADVKEALVADRAVLRSLIDLGKTGNQNITYGVVSLFVNLTNSYDKPEIEPEMKELAKFAKQHVPIDDPKDAPEYVQKRITALVEEGVGSALVAVSQTESKGLKESIARVLNVLLENKEHRGLLVQQGVAKVLLKLWQGGTERGKECACQALSRIGITINPEIAFPGQRSWEVLRPILSMLKEEKNALQNFEALLALTNLAQMSESVRQRIVKEGGLSMVEHYLYEDHDMLKRAATQCICNLMLCKEVQEVYIISEADRIKLLLLYCVDEDPDVSKSACGALAMLAEDPRACKKIIQYPVWLDVMKEISVSEDADIRLRGLYIISSLIRNNDQAAEAITSCELLEILMATSQLIGQDNAKARDVAMSALKAAAKKKIIAPNPIYDEEDE
ncbi:hypothetical protein RvY_15029 [Ramazzottius varieornatus]|uniref:Protein unc-45 homolog B n=1 Tax=Ramazzottius varieornatus TaxID=947166 RepID=A0A1D1VV44_RAMVA|nr:hypothetical protein RvY_15029 [Ramazzottius varieornatus]